MIKIFVPEGNLREKPRQDNQGCVYVYSCLYSCECALKLGITNKRRKKTRLGGRVEGVQESVHWNGASNRYRSGQAGVVVRKSKRGGRVRVMTRMAEGERWVGDGRGG